MPIDRDFSGTPEAELPALGGRLRQVEPGQAPQTLAYRLVPVVDVIREIPTVLGVRHYRVFMVHGSWTGGRDGVGTLQLVSRQEILPTPRVKEVGSLSEVLRSTGITEEGDVVVDRISARFTEDDLRGLTPDLRDPNLPRTLAVPFDFWWEVVENRPQVPFPAVRRFNVVGVPELSRGRVEWVVRLAKQDWDRGRMGETNKGSL